MAKYDLQPIQSMYRDTGAVQINQLKRQEYLANMQADNALATSVMNMEALDKDRDKLENLAELYTSKIDQRGQRKDYENLGMSIAQDAMDFTKDYTPIKRQVDIRAGYKASLDEAVKAKRIDQSTANNLLAESDYNYKGVETSPSGIVDRDSFYQGSSFVGNINVNELMQEEMKDYVERFSKTQSWSLLDDQLIPVDDGKGNITFKMKTTAEDFFIDPKEVEKIANNVLNRPEVIASMSQQARLDTYRSGELLDGQEKSEATLGIEANTADIKKDINMLKKRLAKGDLSEEQRSIIEQNIASLSKSVDYNNDYLKSGKDPVALFKTIKFTEIAEGHQDYFVGKYSYLNTVRKTDLTTIGDGTKSEYTKHVPSLTQYLDASEDLANVVSGGLTVESIYKHRQDNQNILDDIYTRFNSNESNPSLNNPNVMKQLLNVQSKEDLSNINLYTASGAKLDESAVLNLVNSAKRADDNVRLLNRRVREAVASVHGDMVLPNGEIDQKKYTEFINHLYNNMQFPAKGRYTQTTEEASGPTANLYDGAAVLETLSYPDVRDAAIEAGLVPKGSDTKTVLDLLKNSDKVKGVPNPLDDDQKPTEIPSVANAIIDKLPDVKIGEGETPLWAAQDFINLITQQYGDYELDNDKQVQEHLDNSEIKMLYAVDGNYGDPTANTSKTINEAIKHGFTSNMVVYAEGNPEPIAINQWLIENDMAKGKKKKGKITGVEDGYEIITKKTGLVTVANQNGQPMIAVAVKNKKTEDTKFVFMPAGQLDVKYKGVSEMRNYINSTAFKLERLYNTGDAYNIDSDTPSIPGMKVRFNYANPTEPVEITFGVGENAKTKAYPKEDGLNLIESKLDGAGLGYLLH